MLAFSEIYWLSARQYANCCFYSSYLIWSSQQLREGNIKKTEAYWIKQLTQGYLPTSQCLCFIFTPPPSLPSVTVKEESFFFFKVQSVHFTQNPIPSCLPEDFFHVIILFPFIGSFLSAHKHNVESPKLNSLCPHITFQLLPISHFSSYSTSHKTPIHSVSPALSSYLHMQNP